MNYVIKLLQNILTNLINEINTIDKMVKEGKDDYPYDYQELHDKKNQIESALNKLEG